MQHSAYEVLLTEELVDIHAKGYLLRHKKSGAHISLIENDDDNKVFYIGFRTPTDDSTGVPHIIEHTVLCGSDKYPVKDPFVELVKGSMNTFLNAMTYPDKTVYPVASCNDKDFDNLIDVYMDAVFHPNIYHYREIFQQEGWHYELEDAKDDITINGVVYNEMKGAFSSPESMLSRSILNSLYPDTTYANESGGDPAYIPTLTYNGFLDFHRRYYHPCNSYIYLYGDMDFEEKLDYLDKEYLSHYEEINLDSSIDIQKPFDEPRELHYEYAIGEEESLEDATYLSYNFTVGTVLDPMLYQAFEILDYALLSIPGAPVREALLEAGIGRDIMSNFDNGVLQPYYSIVVKGANPDDREKFLEVVEKALAEVVEKGINKDTLLAGINANQFSFREADFGRFPKGLIYGLQMLDSWLYDKNQPFLHLNGVQVLDELREKVETGYFEELVDKYLCKNPHATVIALKPRRGLTSILEEAQKQKLDAFKSSLSRAEIEEIIQNTKHLKEYQETPSAPEDLEKIPMLRREDMKKTCRPITYNLREVDGTKVVYSAVHSNGIHYLKFLFNADMLKVDELPAFSLMVRLFGLVNTENYSYLDLTTAMHLSTGGIYTDTTGYEDGEFKSHFGLECGAKFLYRDLDKALELIKEMILRSDFSDKKRMKDLIAQEKSGVERKMNNEGHLLASMRCLSQVATSPKLADITSGISYYQYLKDLEENFDERIDDLIEQFKDLSFKVITPSNLIVSSTGEESAFDQIAKALPGFKADLFPDMNLEAANDIVCTKKNEGFKDASQIQYVCSGGNFKKAGFEYTGAMHIMKSVLGYDYFWINVRVKGGAYGCMSAFRRNGDVYFVSYRDPNLAGTKEVFEKTPEYLASFDANERDMTKYIIGTISDLDTPLTPAQVGKRNFGAYLGGVTTDIVQKERTEVLNASVEDIRALAPLVQAVLDQNNFCVVGCETNVEANAELFDEVLPLF